MLADYFIWQYSTGPRWLLGLLTNVERSLYHFFSVPLMVKTLFAHWHRDAVAYRLAGIGSLVVAFAWNQISRAIGFMIRATVLLLWALSAATTGLVGIVALILFIFWPVVVVAFATTGVFFLEQAVWYV